MDANKPNPSSKMLDARTWDALRGPYYTKDDLHAEQSRGPPSVIEDEEDDQPLLHTPNGPGGTPVWHGSRGAL